MSADRDVTRIVRSWLHEDAYEDADRILNLVLDEIDTTPQRSVSWLARRFPPMNSNFVRVALAAAAVVVIAIIGFQYLGGPNTGGPGATETPQPTATVEPSPSPPASPPPLTQSFTSTVHGISVSYPEGWIARAATEPWTDRPGEHQFIHPGFDVLHDPVLTDHLFLYIVSQPIGDSTPEEWVAALMAGSGCTTTEPIAVDGATGLIGGGSCEVVAAVTTAGRGYEIALLTSDDDPAVVAPYDRAWFEEVLATVQLHPEDAVDSGASPSP